MSRIKFRKMDIIKYKYSRIDGKMVSEEIKHKYYYRILCNICRCLFETIHYNHYWLDGKKILKTIKITGIRSALVESEGGQKSRVEFCWKKDKYFKY
jgi:hypothetical protein